MENKHPAKSKTIYANLVSLGVVPLLTHFGIKVTPEITVVVMAVANIILRFMTKGSLGLSGSDTEKKIGLLYKAYKQLKKDVEDLKNAKKD